MPLDLSGRGPWPVLAFVALILAAFVALVITDHDTSGLVALLGILGVGGGLAAHTEVRAQQQNAALDTITHQTNGVLTKRIEAGAAKACRLVLRDELRQLGYPIPTDTEAPPDKVG